MPEYDFSQHMLVMLTISVYFHEDTRSVDKEIRLCLLVTPSLLEYQKDLFPEENVRHDDPEKTSPQRHGQTSCMRIGDDPLDRKISCEGSM